MMRKSTCIELLAVLMLTVSPIQAQTPVLVKNINPSIDDAVQILTCRDVLSGVLYFDGNDGSGNRLWRTDGTAVGTWMVKDVDPDHIVTLHDKLYFVANNGVEPGSDPWVSDGTISGTVQLHDLAVGKNRSKSAWHLCATASDVYFTYTVARLVNSSVETQLWKTDGTASGTGATGARFDVVENITTAGNRLLLFAGDGSTGEEPWISDGTGQGTNLILDICSVGNCEVDYYPTTVERVIYASKIFPVGINGVWYFARSDGITGEELWRTDGTAAGTGQVADINPGPGSSFPNFFVEMSGVLYFAADDGINGMELWKYPLTGGPATMVKDIAGGSADSEPIWLTPVDGTLFFSAWSDDGGRELWRSDGTNAGTVQVADIAPGSNSSNPNYDLLLRPQVTNAQDYWRRFTILGNKLFFAADDGDGYELFESDGTSAGTIKLADINPTTGEGSSPHYLTVLNGSLLFTAYHPSYGNEWWSLCLSGNQPPVAVAAASPSTGAAPLTVTFDGSGSYDPDGSITAYFWEFGDGSGFSTLMNPTYTYSTAGTYTVQLTVTDNNSATAADDVSITVSPASSGYVYVADQTVTRVLQPGNKYRAEDVIRVWDDSNSPVGGVLVHATYSGPTSGTVSGTTDENGEVLVCTGKERSPVGTWCFTVTDVVAAGWTYESSMNVVTTACEGALKQNPIRPSSAALNSVTPNPVTSSAVVRFSLRNAQQVSLRLFDVLGRGIISVREGKYERGTHFVRFTRGDLPAGMYMLELKTGTTVAHHMVCVQ